jgi:hypothetical protein
MDVAEATARESRSMSPDAILAAFETRGPLPRAALAGAGACRAELVPRFLDRIEALAGAGLDEASEDVSFVFIYHLLAEWRETSAYRPILRLLRSDPALVDALMDDGITECGARVVAGLFDGDLQPIFAAALDEGADEYVRGQMFDALAMVAQERPGLVPDIRDFLRRFPASASEGTPSIVWADWSFAVADLGLADMRDEVRRVYDEGRIDPQLARYANFENDLRRALSPVRTELGRRRGLITDTIAELSTWYCFSPAYLEREADAARLARVVPAAVVSARPKTGRNDPCPCGSGRKYKKCCLQ